MKTSPARVALCSACGTTLNQNGECLACLVSVGFDEGPEEPRGPHFGQYEIARREDGSFWELGRGAMGVTYRAEDKILKRTVALKVIDAPVAAGSEQMMRERFLREARAAATLRHPNVAGVFHFGTSSFANDCYYAMELIEGETLAALVRREGPLQVETALEVAVQVTRALIAAAANGLIHRDLKPGNIMLTRNGDDAAAELEVKVIDFGLAKIITASGSEMELTQGGFLGTPAFASPEQFRGAPADARSDIYSLGVTLWYALTGELPYEGKTVEEIRHAQSTLALPMDRLARRKVPRVVIQLFHRLLAIDPAERPSSARELMPALELCRARLTHTSLIHHKLTALAASLAIAAAAFFAFQQWRHKEPAPQLAPPKSIAVLPFQNMSNDKQNAYFADGVHEEILTTLAKVTDLKVISRTSVMRFRDAEKRNLREIARQLGVAHVLEGSVQRATNRIRVTAQLIDTRTDSHVWAEQYDGELADVFAIQSEIAQKIAGQLNAVLSPRERAAIEQKPTTDLIAYDFYLRAKEIWRESAYDWPGLRKQVELLNQAIAHDPSFLSALRRLTELHLGAYWHNFDRTPARLALAESALERAAQLKPDAGEVHLSRGIYHYWAHLDLVPALTELQMAGRTLPNDTDVLFFTGLVERRLGRWEDSIRSFKRALILDPRNANLAYVLADDYVSLRRYEEARAVLKNVLAWKPDYFQFRAFAAYVDFFQYAALTALAKVYSESPPGEDPNELARQRRRIAYLRRDYRAAEKALAEYSLPNFVSEDAVVPRDYYEGLIARALEDASRAEAAFLRAREIAAAKVSEQPDDASALMTLARIDAASLRRNEAVREAERAVDLLPVTKDAYQGARLLELLAEIYAEVGEGERALDVLRKGMLLPNGVTYGELQLHEAFDPLRNDPRFQKIVASLAPDSAHR